MAIELVKEKCAAPINIVEIGPAGKCIRIGGQTALPLLYEDGVIPHAPVVAAEVFDCAPAEWPDALTAAIGPAVKDPVAWAKKAVTEWGVGCICVRMQSVHPDAGGRSSDEAVATLKAIAAAVDVPLVIIGCGDSEKDNEVLPKASQALKGARCLLGIATQNNYKTLTVTCLADGHSIIAESPIDVNIAKQLNMLISDMGIEPARIVIHPTTTALGYGMEYVYSIMERARLAAFVGDKMLAMPFILFTGQEVWKVKEAKEFGEAQGVNWETATAVSMVQAGADLLVMRHPGAMKAVGEYVRSVTSN